MLDSDSEPWKNDASQVVRELVLVGMTAARMIDRGAVAMMAAGDQLRAAVRAAASWFESNPAPAPLWTTYVTRMMEACNVASAAYGLGAQSGDSLDVADLDIWLSSMNYSSVQLLSRLQGGTPGGTSLTLPEP